MPEEKVLHKCLSIIVLNSVLYAYEKYHRQIFLEECKYAKENIKSKDFIDMELESKKFYETSLLSTKLEPVIMLIASSLLISQKWIL